MGIDQGTMGLLQQGLGLVEDSMSRVNEAEEQGRMLETDAKGNALDMQRQTKKDAKNVRSTQEALRARRNTGWGKSNLAMSGSKKLVKESSRSKDHQSEEDILFEGQMDADEILNTGRHKANMLRINRGATPVRSTLSLGSKIYGPRR